jgi:hypothetical protein
MQCVQLDGIHVSIDARPWINAIVKGFDSS